MKALILICIIIFTFSCGVKGNPIPPSQEEKEHNIIFNKSDSHTNNENITSLWKLEKIGQDYNADFGESTEELDDLFERLKPKNALPKKTISKDLF